jgi:pimeloyl-ACP methyl ester carboxylesterase
MKNVGLLILMLGVASVGQAQRNVHWIHGVGSNSGVWQLFANDFNAQRQIPTTTRADYVTNNGVGTMVNGIINVTNPTLGQPSIAIGHSMGGVAARQIDVNNGRFGGIITFDSPLRGARVINNLNGPAAADYIENAYERLISGPRVDPLTAPILLGVLLGTNIIEDFSGAGIVQNLRTQLSLTPATIGDLAEESGYNQGFYGNSTGTPKLVYWGNENSPVHVRAAASSVGADENAYVNAWIDARGVYGAKRDLNHTLRWVFFTLYPFYNWVGNEWAKGYNYLYDQSENEWSNLIGAGYTTTRSYYTFEFVGTDYNAYQDCVNSANGDPVQVQNCENTYFQWVHHDEVIFIRDASDAVVPFRSQTAQGTAWVGNAEVRELPGVNHSEVLTSNQSRNELNFAFNGFAGGGNFFIPARP